MEQITIKQLENLCVYLNRLTGYPEKRWTLNARGNLRVNIGNYHISYAYGCVRLNQNMNERGGVAYPLGEEHIPKRRLWEQMQAYIRGIEDTLSKKRTR